MPVSRTVSHIFSVKEWRDLEVFVCGRSWALKMVRSVDHTTFYWSAIVSSIYTASSQKRPLMRFIFNCTIFELFDVE